MPTPKLSSLYRLTEAADLKKVKTPEDAIEQAKDLALEVQASSAALHEYMDAQATDPMGDASSKGQLPAIVAKLDQMKQIADEIEKLAGQAASSMAAQEVAESPAGKTFGKV